MINHPIPLYRIAFDKAKLSCVPQAERLLFFALGHLANEINALNKQVLWCFKPDSEPAAVSKAQISLALIFLRLLAGKLKEGYLLLERYYLCGKPPLASTYESLLPSDMQDNLKALKRYFCKKNAIDTIRSNYGFHYSPSEIEAALALVPDDLELFVAENFGNSLYYASEVLANRAMLRAIDPDSSDDVATFHRIVGDVVAVAGKMLSLAAALMAGFIQRHSDIFSGTAEELSLPGLVELREFQVPWFAFERTSPFTEDGAPNTRPQADG